MHTETPLLTEELPPANTSVSAAINRTLQYLQAQRRANGTWVGELSSSALATARPGWPNASAPGRSGLRRRRRPMAAGATP